jgi:drug/metabolite transporter (DMT)-like permease
VPTPASPRPRRALGLAVLVALVGGAIVFGIGNLDLGSGLVALSAAVGWATGLALAEGGGRGGSWPMSPVRPILAGGLAAAGVAVAMLALGLYAQAEGGVLPLVDYLAQRFGPLPLIDIAVAGLAGAIRAR